MTTTYLVAYTTRYGTTREVAETIGATLRESGLAVDVLPMRRLDSLEQYRAIVLGAPFYMGHWPDEVKRFLLRHRAALARRPVAVFALGPIRGDEQERREAPAQLDQELERYPWLTPVARQMFGGAYDPSRLDFSHRLLTAMPASPLHGLPARDLRDWGAIRAWAGALPRLLAPAPVQAR